MNQIVLYVGNFFYPRGNAAGKRIYGNIKAIQEAGFKTACLSFGKEVGDQVPQKRVYEGTTVFEIPYCDGFRRMNNRKPYRHFINVVKKLQKESSLRAVIMYGTLGNSGFNKKILRWCKINKIKIMYDLADWFDHPSKNNILRYLIKKRDLNQLQNYVLPRCDAWITISTFLRDRMPEPDKVLVIPPLAAEVTEALPRKESDVTTFAYASFVTDKKRPVSEWKDRIDVMVDVFYDIYTVHNRQDFLVKFVGFEKQALLDMFVDEYRKEYANKLETLSENVVFLGPRSNEEVAEEIRNSDFTMLIRDSKTCTNAGFATKVSESVSLGIPVLVNDTSDVSMYIKDGQNGYILPSPTDVSGIASQIMKCMEMSFAEKNNLKKSTYCCGAFYYHAYTKTMKNFLT